MIFISLKKSLVMVLGAVFFACFCSNLSAVEPDENVYEQIDQAFYEHSIEMLSSILAFNIASASYNLYEAYVLKKVRHLIVEEDLVFARDASLCLVDNNLENFDAVELYSFIDRTLINQQNETYTAGKKTGKKR